MRQALQILSGPREYAITVIQFNNSSTEIRLDEPMKGPDNSGDWTVLDWKAFETGAVIMWHRPKFRKP